MKAHRLSIALLLLPLLAGCRNTEQNSAPSASAGNTAYPGPVSTAPTLERHAIQKQTEPPAATKSTSALSTTSPIGSEQWEMQQRMVVHDAQPFPVQHQVLGNLASIKRSTPGDRGGARMSSGASSFGKNRYAGALASQPVTPSQPGNTLLMSTSQIPRATYNPNLYLGSNYTPGNGEKDRMEKLINAGVMVDGKQVKLEAFPRNYAQTFPIPTRTALDLVAATERTKIVTQGDHTYLQIGLQAIKGEAPRRPPLNIALVIDHSGSMADDSKLENAKQAAIQLVERLNARDTFSLTVFDDTVQVLVPAQHVTGKAQIERKIAALTPGGNTDIYAGLTAGYQQAHKFLTSEGVNRVILLSDGEVTTGISDPEKFHQLCASNADQDIQTTSVGLGLDFNQDLMLGIANSGRGAYHFIKNGADTRTVFAEEMDQLTHIVAKALKVRVQLADGIGFVRALGASRLDAEQTAQAKAQEKQIDKKVAEELGIVENRQHTRDEPGIKMLIPDFYRGDSHVIMLEIAVPPGAGHRNIASVSLQYKDLVSPANREAHATVAIDYTPDRAAMIASIDRSVKKNLLGFQTGEALTRAADLVGQGRIAEAVKQVDERMVVMGVAAREWNDRDLDRDGQLLNQYRSVLTDLNAHPEQARAEYGQYLSRSLTYNGYQMTR